MTQTMEAGMSIGALAERTQCKVQTIRYYEQIGLLPPPRRNEGNQRRYGEDAVKRLTFIRHARDFGFAVESVRELLEMADHPDLPCEEADALARHHLREVEARLARLSALRDELKRMLTQCQGGSVNECRVIEVLSDHRLCLHDEPHGGAQDIH
ncbi:MerR family transcriptional regulator [Aidingimonas halophila]|uniref:DNA-binding transcriptional regulator, MerR family n=1 Tax=Aidingimonas halophila TaxID=574349 RepID=A0A1H2QG42_9GAMM|nr:helix-turn-helix domain-containing protein [Aidingimonas halophila]GHC20842.1 MerR family transcriptional regulator [Aidingimonas halophila]SDW05808.1 DNA-binding transcriptional regulator, MerR family [Aidingimonas halophila]